VNPDEHALMIEGLLEVEGDRFGHRLRGSQAQQLGHQLAQGEDLDRCLDDPALRRLQGIHELQAQLDESFFSLNLGVTPGREQPESSEIIQT